MPWNKVDRTPFEEAFHDITGEWPTPLSVAAALKDPEIKASIEEQLQAVIDQREMDAYDDN